VGDAAVVVVWTAVAPPISAGVWAVWTDSASEAWALADGIVLHHDGKKWSSKVLTPALNWISGAAGDVWAVGGKSVFKLQ